MCEKLKLNSSPNFDNVDTPIIYVEKFNEYGLKIYDNGSSSILIEFCPWCGEKLPNSKREEWFDQIEKLEINPWKDEVPKKYKTDEWYKRNGSR
ncbi:MAG: hypothetical protein RL108_776 [Bacteroidota bacterium]|jgi:hypothetical protein